MPRAFVLIAALFAPLPAVAAQTPVDSAIAAYVNGVRAIDVHAHPMRYVAPNAAADTEYDALPLDGLPPFELPWRLRTDNPEWRVAQQALYSFHSADTGAAYHDALVAARDRIMRREGEHYPSWVLDQAGIDIMLANRIVLGAGLPSDRFAWVPFADALMLPLDVRGEAARTPDTRSLYPLEAKLLRRYLRDLGVRALPATLDDYVKSIVAPTLERQKRGGAVSVKFEAAYLRPLNFDDTNPAEARRVYAKYVRGGVPTHAEYKALEDYLFREIARRAGAVGMSVQIHTLETFGGFYSPAGAAPHLLEPALSDSTLRGTNFVIVHGGWPLTDETMGLLSRPNVYADISMMVLLAEPSRIAPVLRKWLGEWPGKVLFGTDAFDGGADQSWAEVAWLGANTGRRALAMALTGMMRDGEVDASRARALARMVLRENAGRAYPALGARASDVR